METRTKVFGVATALGLLYAFTRPKVVIKTLKVDPVNKIVQYYMKYYDYEITDTFVMGDIPNIVPVGDGKHFFAASGIPLTGAVELDIGYEENGGFKSIKGLQVFFDGAITGTISGSNGNEILEYYVSYGGKYYVTTNIDFSGRGIKKVGDGSDHKRGLMTYLFTENALDRIIPLHPTARYIQDWDL